MTVLAASTAGLLASRPYVTRPVGRSLVALLWLSAVAAAVLGEGLPFAVIGTVVLAWGAAAGSHLIFGTPEATPSLDQVTAALAELGVIVDDLRLAPEQRWGGTTFVAGAGADGELAIRVVGRDSTDAHIASKLWRFLWYKDSEPTFTLTRGYQIEHQAYVLLLGGQDGGPGAGARRRRHRRLA